MCLAYFFDMLSLGFVQPGTIRRTVDRSRHQMSALQLPSQNSTSNEIVFLTPVTTLRKNSKASEIVYSPAKFHVLFAFKCVLNLKGTKNRRDHHLDVKTI